MSVLVTPLPDGDALIMMKTLTMFLRHVHVIRRSRTKKTEIVTFLGQERTNFYFDDNQLDDVCEQLFKMDLVYSTESGKTIFPKVNAACAYKEPMLGTYHCRTEKFVISISKETFVRIQEDFMLKHAEATELEKLRHENMLMRAHIEFSPDGPKFLETMNNLKARAKDELNSKGC